MGIRDIKRANQRAKKKEAASRRRSARKFREDTIEARDRFIGVRRRLAETISSLDDTIESCTIQGTTPDFVEFAKDVKESLETLQEECGYNRSYDELQTAIREAKDKHRTNTEDSSVTAENEVLNQEERVEDILSEGDYDLITMHEAVGKIELGERVSEDMVIEVGTAVMESTSYEQEFITQYNRFYQEVTRLTKGEK